jgi:hypothetical protein
MTTVVPRLAGLDRRARRTGWISEDRWSWWWHALDAANPGRSNVTRHDL